MAAKSSASFSFIRNSASFLNSSDWVLPSSESLFGEILSCFSSPENL
jgi:hypothetical protein